MSGTTAFGVHRTELGNARGTRRGRSEGTLGIRLKRSGFSAALSISTIEHQSSSCGRSRAIAVSLDDKRSDIVWEKIGSSFEIIRGTSQPNSAQPSNHPKLTPTCQTYDFLQTSLTPPQNTSSPRSSDQQTTNRGQSLGLGRACGFKRSPLRAARIMATNSSVEPRAVPTLRKETQSLTAQHNWRSGGTKNPRYPRCLNNCQAWGGYPSSSYLTLFFAPEKMASFPVHQAPKLSHQCPSVPLAAAGRCGPAGSFTADEADGRSGCGWPPSTGTSTKNHILYI